jgi:hypothetical protein
LFLSTRFASPFWNAAHAASTVAEETIMTISIKSLIPKKSEAKIEAGQALDVIIQTALNGKFNVQAVELIPLLTKVRYCNIRKKGMIPYLSVYIYILYNYENTCYHNGDRYI